MAYVPNSGSVVSFQGTVPWSVLGNNSVSGTVQAQLQSTNASVITVTQGSVATVIIGGSIAASFTPPANQSVSGTVNVGNFPTTQNVSGSVAALVTNTVTVVSSISGGIFPISGSVAATVTNTVNVNTAGSVVAFQGTNPWIVTGSVQASLTPAANQSVSGTVQTDVRGSVATVIIGGSISATFNPPANQSVSGTVLVNQGTNPWIITGSVQGSFSPSGNQSVSGTVAANVQGSVATVIIGGSIAASFTPPANQSVSGTVQTQVQASVAVVIIGGSILTSSAANQSVSGTVGASLIGLSPVSVSNFPTNQNVSGSVISFQGTTPWVTNVSSLISMPAIVSAANSTTTPITSTLSFTGTGEEWKDFGTVTLNVFTDATSAVDGLSIQQSSDNVNWDVRDTYTIPSMVAGGGKTFTFGPAARYGRIVYTQGAQNSGAFRLQTVYHPQRTKPSSQRPSDGYTNETDTEQISAFGMVYNGTTWDRARGNATSGTLVFGSVQAVQSGTWNVSVAGIANIAGSVAATITNTNLNVSGSVVAFQGAGWSGSVAATIIGIPNVNVAGSVVAFQGGTQITSLVSTVPSSVLVGASIFGQLPAGTAMIGSIAAYQGSVPWAVAGSVATVQTGTTATSIQGTVSVLGTVPVTQSGTWVTSIIGGASVFQTGTWQPSALGYITRNDTVASFLGADLTTRPIMSDSAGRQIVKPFAANEASITGHNSIVGGGNGVGSVVLFAAAGAGLKNYMTDFSVSNTGATTTLVIFADGDGSVLGRTIAPAGGGSNMPGMATPIVNVRANTPITVVSSTATSVLWVSAYGYKAP